MQNTDAFTMPFHTIVLSVKILTLELRNGTIAKEVSWFSESEAGIS